MLERRMSLEVYVKPIFFSSCFTVNASETRIRVPSERTTRSRGVMRKANGSLELMGSALRILKYALKGRKGRLDLRQALDDHKCYVCVWGHTSSASFGMVLGQTARNIFVNIAISCGLGSVRAV